MGDGLRPPRRLPVGAGSAVGPSAPTRARPAADGDGRGIGRTPILVGLAVLALAIVVGGVAAFLILPSATAVVTPREETIGPVSLRITASTDITEPNIEAGLVPAEVVSIDVQADDTFPATGTRVEEKKAKGVVRFQNLDFTSSNTVAKGAIVRTRSGVRFRTDKSVTVPAAKLVGVTIFASEKDVKVTAVEAGPDGNVPAGAIQVPPRGEAFLNVTNPQPTSGGTREEFPRVTQADVDAAQAALSGSLTTDFQDRLDDADLVPEGITVFPETAALDSPTYSEDADTLVGQEVESFDLAATATGTVTTVDSAPVRVIAEAKLDSSVEAGHQLVEGSSRIDEAPAVVEGATIAYPVVATARQIALLDPAVLKAAIIGKPVAEAQAILDAYGDTNLQTWPDWVSTIPTIESRVDVSVDGPVVVETPGELAGPGRLGVAGGQPVSTILGLDLGERRIGVAIADADGLRRAPARDAAPAPVGRGRRRGAGRADRDPRRHGARPRPPTGSRRTGRIPGRPDARMGRRAGPAATGRRPAVLAGRAAVEPPRRGATRPDEARTIGRTAVAKPAQRLPRPGRP